MTEKSDQMRILEWAENLKNTDPAWWGRFLEGVDATGAEAEQIALRRVVAMCAINSEGIPKEWQWSGRDSELDQECQRCEY